MRTFRYLAMGFVGLVVTFSTLSLMSGCGDDSNTTGSQVKATEEAKKQEKSVEDRMREAMAKKAATKGSSSAPKK